MATATCFDSFPRRVQSPMAGSTLVIEEHHRTMSELGLVWAVKKNNSTMTAHVSVADGLYVLLVEQDGILLTNETISHDSGMAILELAHARRARLLAEGWEPLVPR
jgi:hypothetical protein